MRFVCDSCHAQYMISDDKVGASGVKVRCKKCGHVIIVRRQVDAGVGAEADAALRGLQEMSAPSNLPTEATTGESSIFSDVDDEEIGAAFDSALSERRDAPPPTEDLDSTRVMDEDAVARLAALSEGNVPAASDAAPPTAHAWYVAIDDKQTGPLTPDAIKEHWDRGEIGPDSLTWRQGLEDWVPLSEVSELASWLAPRPARPVFTPSSSGVAPMVTVPVESAFSAGGVTRTVRTEVPTPVPEPGGWRPSASAALASLVKDEIDALSKPEPPPPASDPTPAARGLLEVPPASPEMPAGQMNGRRARAEAPTPVTGAERPSFPAAYPYVTRPRPASRRGLFIGLGMGAVVLVGLVGAVGYLLLRTEKPAPVAAVVPPPPAEPPKAATPSPVKPPSAVTTPAAQPPPATGVTPAVPPVAKVTPAVPPGESGTSLHRGGKRSSKQGGNGTGHGGDEEVASPSPSPSQPRSSGSRSKADDLFDEVFGSGGGGGEKKSSDSGKGGKRSAYVPPEPGSSSTEVPDRLPKGDIMSVVLANKPSIVRCVNEQKSRDPNLHGTLVVHWIIQTSGKTTAVQPMTDPFKSSYMATCLTGLVKSWTFPKHKYQPGEPVDFPFTF
jgi:predicted Zn finger-like uncharacterized protein